MANASLGGPSSYALDRAFRRSINYYGVPWVVSAGNEATNACSVSPAGVWQAITVGASSLDDRQADFSNDGVCVDVFAPGVNIAGAFNTSDNAGVLFSGTSQAAPHVTGFAAQLLEIAPWLSSYDLEEIVVYSATYGELADVTITTPNLLLYTGWLNE